MEVLGVTSYGDLTSFAQQQSRASAFILSIDDEELALEPEETLAELRAFVTEIRNRNAEIPIFLHGETRTSRHIPNDVLRELHGFIHMFEDTPEFIARNVKREAKAYLDSLPPPFFRALTHYAADGSYSWHCPGHSGGVAFLKSPVGQMFHQFFGENMLRADVCNAVEELGQLLDHTGPVAASERNAARIFNADHLYFVTNGTSTSNKIVWHSTVAPGDIVVVDRNCHKSILHAIMMTGAIPVFLMPTRNNFGIIGPIPKSEFAWESIQKKIAANPFITDKTAKPRVLTITQSTYDGILYNVEDIKESSTARSTPCISTKPGCRTPPSTISTATTTPSAPTARAARSRWSSRRNRRTSCWPASARPRRSWCRTAENRKLDRDIFNEAYLMHTSTSPQYSIIASCDVAAAMMEEPGGTALVEESIAEALDFRRAMRKVDEEWGADWWFKVWGPDDLSEEGIEEREAWMLKPGERWHGFGNLADGFNMLDPIKATIITPGLDVDGDFADEFGIPAAIVTKYLAEHGVIVEKCGLYSFFIMFTIGITKGRWNTLVTALQQFKDDYDKNQPLWKVLPEFVQKNPRYERVGLRDLCTQIHGVYKLNDVARLTTEMYLSDMVPAMRPADAFAKMAHREIERVPVDALEGRVTAVLLTPYPPGIPLLIPGERFNKTICSYLQVRPRIQRRASPASRPTSTAWSRAPTAPTTWIACADRVGRRVGGPVYRRR
jgi:arginine decarboxylase